MKWKLATKDWARSDTGHGVCKTSTGRYASWKGWKFLGFADSKDQANKLCSDDHSAKKQRK